MQMRSKERSPESYANVSICSFLLTRIMLCRVVGGMRIETNGSITIKISTGTIQKQKFLVSQPCSHSTFHACARRESETCRRE